MPQVFSCPTCQKQLRVQDELRGKRIRCPSCKTVITCEAPEEPLVATPVEDEEAFTGNESLGSGWRRDRDQTDDDEADDEPPASRSRQARRRGRRDDVDDVEDELERKRPMPASVLLAVIATCILLGLEVAGAALTSMQGLNPEQLGKALSRLLVVAVLGGLILWGLVAGHRLAWQWGRVLGMLGAIIMLLVGIAAIAAGQPGFDRLVSLIVGAAALVNAAILFTIAFALGTASAKKYFSLRCPSCGRFTSKAADFLFNRARCKQCDKVW